MTNKRGQTSTISKRQLYSKNNKVNTKTAKKEQQSPEKLDTTYNRKRTAAIIPKSNEKRPRVLAVDVQWCVCNVSMLTLKAFALEHDYYERRRCHARYKAIITNMPKAEQSRLLQEFENWCLTLDYTEIWKERKRKYVLAAAAANCSEAIDKMLVSDSQGLVELQNQTPTTELQTPRPTRDTTASHPVTTAMTADLDQEQDHTRQGNDNEEEKHWIIDGNDITSLFLKYRYQADIIPKPIPLESSIQEILALSNVFFLANEQHSECKMTVFREQLLKNLLKHQTQALLSNVPRDAPNFTNDDFMAMVNIVSAIDEENMSLIDAKLHLLTLATSMGRFKSNVVEGIADL